ncbi:unnamed protein product [Amoebophrya sp. A120]|nr:unnamed protein product [Amoebophrya sp. A120]|eukprot:GSA120T00015727001.1
MVALAAPAMRPPRPCGPPRQGTSSGSAISKISSATQKLKCASSTFPLAATQLQLVLNIAPILVALLVRPALAHADVTQHQHAEQGHQDTIHVEGEDSQGFTAAVDMTYFFVIIAVVSVAFVGICIWKWRDDKIIQERWGTGTGGTSTRVVDSRTTGPPGATLEQIQIIGGGRDADVERRTATVSAPTTPGAVGSTFSLRSVAFSPTSPITTPAGSTIKPSTMEKTTDASMMSSRSAILRDVYQTQHSHLSHHNQREGSAGDGVMLSSQTTSGRRTSQSGGRRGQQHGSSSPRYCTGHTSSGRRTSQSNSSGLMSPRRNHGSSANYQPRRDEKSHERSSDLSGRTTEQSSHGGVTEHRRRGSTSLGVHEEQGGEEDVAAVVPLEGGSTEDLSALPARASLVALRIEPKV